MGFLVLISCIPIENTCILRKFSSRNFSYLCNQFFACITNLLPYAMCLEFPNYFFGYLNMPQEYDLLNLNGIWILTFEMYNSVLNKSLSCFLFVNLMYGVLPNIVLSFDI